MKPTLRKGAVLLASALVISSAAPAVSPVYAAKNFTYAYQTGGTVSKLSLETGNSIDLRFLGVNDYKNYPLSWTSSNPDVAVVDKNGVVTALSDGNAIIKLNVGDGSAYVSEGVSISVGKRPEMKVLLGTSKNDTFDKYTLEDGKTVDLNFYGVTDWSNSLYSTQWNSSNPKVATVDKYGVVTPVASGTTTVTIAIINRITGDSLSVTPVEFTVPAAEIEASQNFTVRQTSDSAVILTFEDKDITAADLEKNLSFYYYVGDVQISYPIKVESVKNGVATLSSYVTFTDGTKYGFTYGEESADFTASIGEVAGIQFSWNCEGDTHKAYAGTDTTITYKLLNKNGVDITATAMNKPDASVMFSLVKESENGDFWISDAAEGKIFFNAENAVAQVQIEYITGQYDPETYEPIAGPKAIATIVSSKAPAYGIDATAGAVATIVKNGAAEGESIDWKKTSNIIALGDDEKHSFRLVAKLTDTKGEPVYTDTMDAEKGTFSFATTNNSILYVSEDGSLMTNNTGTVNVLVYFTPAGNTTSTVIAVIPVTVRPARTVSSLVLDKSSDVISTESGNGFNETTFKVTLKDQLGDPIEGEIEITSNVKNLPNGATAAPVVSAVEGADGEYSFTVTGSQENLPSGATGYAYSFTVKAGTLAKSFNVTVKKPAFDKNDNLVISGYKIEFSGDDDLKTTDDKEKFASATLYLLSNGVKAQVAELHKKEASLSNMVAGNYYYTVTKGSNNIEATAASGSAIRIPLTAISETEVDGSTFQVVDKTKNGAGTYTVTIYKGIGSTPGATASALSQVSRNTLTVKDSQDSLSYAGKSSNSFASIDGGVEELVMNSFKFKLGDSVLDNAEDYGNIKLSVNANKVEDGGLLKPGSVCFVKSVDFYVETAEGSNTYVKYTVNVNDYVEIK
ncbi:MAG: Ig-like domain-containing protein [Lachnospiraceae bacterium]|nr:Ig-like domain-containing protein [Lachnospiraceae bacterium]